MLIKPGIKGLKLYTEENTTSAVNSEPLQASFMLREVVCSGWCLVLYCFSQQLLAEDEVNKNRFQMIGGTILFETSRPSHSSSVSCASSQLVLFSTISCTETTDEVDTSIHPQGQLQKQHKLGYIFHLSTAQRQMSHMFSSSSKNCWREPCFILVDSPRELQIFSQLQTGIHFLEHAFRQVMMTKSMSSQTVSTEAPSIRPMKPPAT